MTCMYVCDVCIWSHKPTNFIRSSVNCMHLRTVHAQVYLSVCTYVCLCVASGVLQLWCNGICASVCTYVCLCVASGVLQLWCNGICASVCIRTYVHTHVAKLWLISLHLQVCTYVHTYLHTHTHTHHIHHIHSSHVHTHLPHRPPPLTHPSIVSTQSTVLHRLQ